MNREDYIKFLYKTNWLPLENEEKRIETALVLSGDEKLNWIEIWQLAPSQSPKIVISSTRWRKSYQVTPHIWPEGDLRGKKSTNGGKWLNKKKPHLERSEKKSKENRLFWGDRNLQWNFIFCHCGHFLSHFWQFSLKTLFSRGLRYYGMILLYFVVRFSHFQPLVDFSP